MKADNLQYLEPESPVNVGELNQRVDLAMGNMGWFLDQIVKNDNLVQCRWAGQSEDGRKHQVDIGAEAMPWENASDARVPLADEVIQERVELLMTALRAGKLNVMPANAADARKTPVVKALMAYTLNTQMRDEARKQVELWVRWAQTYNVALMRCDWLEERSIEEKMVTTEDLVAFGMGIGEDGEMGRRGDAETGIGGDGEMVIGGEAEMIAAATEGEIMMMVLDPEREEDLFAMLMERDPAMNRKECRRVIRALRKGKPGVYYVPYVKNSRPHWRALLPGVHIICPVLTEDLQQTSWVCQLHWMDKHQILARVDSDGWDEDWAHEVLNHPGLALSGADVEKYPWAFRSSGLGYGTTAIDATTSEKFQVLEMFHVCQTTSGVNCTYRTVYHPRVSGRDGTLVGLHEVMPERHGKFPFIPLKKDHRSSYLLGGSGVPEEVQSWQNSLKLHHDARDDSTDLRTRPPIEVEARRAGGRIPIGPYAQVPMTRNGSIKFMDVPEVQRDSALIERDIDARVARFMGRTHESVPDSVSQTKQGYLVDSFFTGVSNLLAMTMQLQQQYMNPIDGARVAGMPVPMNLSREEIQGQFDFSLTYDVRDLNTEFVTEKFGLIEKLMMLDTENTIGHAAAVDYLFSAVAPELAPLMLRDAAQQSVEEEDDEVKRVTSIMQGFQPPPRMGMNFDQRFKTFVAQVQQNPRARAIWSAPEQELDEQNLQVKELLMAEYNFLKQQVTQEKNKMIGVLGTDLPLSREPQTPGERMMEEMGAA